MDVMARPLIEELEWMRADVDDLLARQCRIQKLDKQMLGSSLAPVNCYSHLASGRDSRPPRPAKASVPETPRRRLEQGGAVSGFC